MTISRFCQDITPSQSLPRPSIAHQSLHLLGHAGWIYAAQCLHDSQGENRLRLDACELAHGIWHGLLDMPLDPDPLLSAHQHVHCRLSLASMESAARLRLEAISPHGRWRLEQAEARPLSPLRLTSDESAWSSSDQNETFLHVLSALETSVATKISQIAVLGSRLYAAVPDDEYGFALWCTEISTEPASWRLLMQRGAERFVHNRQVLALVPHGQWLFIAAGTTPEARRPESAFFDYQGFELLRLDGDSEIWELIAGVPRVSPDGLKLPISALGPGLGARRRREWCLLHAQAGHLILGTQDEEGLRLWRSSDGEQWEGLAPEGLELIQTVEQARIIVCGPHEAVLALDTRKLDGGLETRLWRLDFAALDN